MSIRVVIAESRATPRAALSLLLATDPGIEVVGSAAGGEEAVTLAGETSPHITLLEVRLPAAASLDAVSRITSRPGPHRTRVLAYSTHPEHEDELLLPVLTAGASGFLTMDTEPRAVLAAIRAVARGDSWLEPQHTRRLINEYVAGTGAAPAGVGPRVPLPPQLSIREREVTALIGRGCTNTEIAEHLCLSPLTAKKYVSRLMAKLGARDRVQLALIAARSLTSLDEPAAQRMCDSH